MPGFTLTKWYLDCADETGRSAVLYWTALAWGRASIVWRSLSFSEPGRAATHRTTLAPALPPSCSGTTILWGSEGLGCTVACTRRQPPISDRLLDRPSGTLDWTVAAPAAQVEVVLGDGRTVRGAGYVERLELTLPPWRLPIDDLRWGRWVSHDATRSVVWIEWRGAEPRIDVYLDAVRQPASRVGADSITAGHSTLRLSDGTAIYSRSLGEIASGIGSLASLLPRSWLAVEDAKWLSAGRVSEGEAGGTLGWAIHEHVRFP
jgi:hypothetical protein